MIEGGGEEAAQTSVIEPLTACNANLVIEFKPVGMASSADRTVSGGSERWEMILSDSSGPLEKAMIRIVVCKTSRLSDHGCTRQSSTSRMGRPGTTLARVSGAAATRRNKGRASAGSMTPGVKFPQKMAERRPGCSVRKLTNVASNSQDAVSFVSRKGAPTRMCEIGPLRRKVSSVSRCMLCSARLSCSKNDQGRSPFRLASAKAASPISHVRIWAARDGLEAKVSRQRVVCARDKGGIWR
jgi:hypothetical protein